MSDHPALVAAQRAIAVLTMALIATQFFLAGAGAFGATSFDAHKTVGSALVLVVLLRLVVAALARRHAVHAAILVGVTVLQLVLGSLGTDDAVDRRVPRPQRPRRPGGRAGRSRARRSRPRRPAPAPATS